MRTLLRVIDALCAAGAWLAGLGVAVMALMLIVEVVATSRLGWSQPWVVEYSGYALAATLFAGTGWTLRTGGHIRMTVLTQMLPPRAMRAADALATLAALATTLYAARGLIEMARRSAELNSVSTYVMRTPLVWPQAVLALGFVLLALALTARLIRLAMGEATEAPPAGALSE